MQRLIDSLADERRDRRARLGGPCVERFILPPEKVDIFRPPAQRWFRWQHRDSLVFHTY